jgi:hypothetical protein
MKYVLLIYASEDIIATMTEEERNTYFREYGTFHGSVIERGLREGGEPLQSTSTSTTVRVRAGKTLTTDGPFAETKEQLAGFYILNCKDLDEAIAVASEMPDAKHGSIEIRPVFEKY